MVKSNVHYQKIFTKLAKIVGESRIEKIPDAPNKLAVKPNTTDDVSRIIKVAVKENIPLIPKRNMFWVSEKTPADEFRIILNTSDMNGIFKIDEENLAVTAGPGVLLKDLYDILYKKGYLLGAYSAVSRSTLGEWIDLGGAGIGSYTYGFAGDLVRSMEVVLPDGKSINTGFEKVLSNSSGYNLNGLFVGSDSTLGVMTKITLKMFPAPEEFRPLYYTFTEPKGMTEAAFELTRLKTTPHNISFFGKNHLKSLRMFDRDVPDLGGMVMNVALAGLKSVVEYDEKVIDEVMEKRGAKKETSQDAQKLWKERFFEVSPKQKKVVPVFCESLVPIKNLFEMIDETCKLINNMKLNGAILGTLCDRSTVSVTPYYLIEERSLKKSKQSPAFFKKVGELAHKHGGRPAGSSTFSTSDLKRVYGEGVNTILDIKSALDPHNILNPDRLG